MLRIRLRRVGAKKQPSYRIVIAEQTAPRNGKFLEVVGFYNPRTEPETVTIKEELALVVGRCSAERFRCPYLQDAWYDGAL